MLYLQHFDFDQFFAGPIKNFSYFPYELVELDHAVNTAWYADVFTACRI